MRFWESGAALTCLVLLSLLMGAELLARLLPPLRRLGVPLALLAGTLGLALGDQGAGLFALDVPLLESLVYHGLAIVFIAVGLRSPSTGGGTAGARSMAFAIVTMFASQAFIGLGLVLLLDPTMHPGVGLLLPMAFEEGPGQALAMGAAWEATGLREGAQVGLITAVFGYGWCIFAGVPWVIWGRRRGWAAPGSSPAAATGPTLVPVVETQAGGLERTSLQVAAVGLCYLLTWAVCSALARLVTGLPDLAPMIWGFHFIIGAAVAMAVRPLLARLPGGSPIDDREMGSVAGFTVDLITAAALAAVQLAVLRTWWLPLLVVTTVGGLWTLLLSTWLARRAWTEAPFEHAVLLFGMSTGTLPTGLALLRVVDPALRSPAAVSAVFGSAGAVVGMAPMLLGLVPATVAAHSGDWPRQGWLMLGAFGASAIVTLALWRLAGGLRFRRPLRSPWPPIGDQG